MEVASDKNFEEERSALFYSCIWWKYLRFGGQLKKRDFNFISGSVLTGSKTGLNPVFTTLDTGNRMLIFCTEDVLTFSSLCFTIFTTSLTFTNSTFCPHSVFMCFVWIWEQTAIISLYSINWLVFVTETECVYCAVRTGYLYIIQVSFGGL